MEANIKKTKVPFYLITLTLVFPFPFPFPCPLLGRFPLHPPPPRLAPTPILRPCPDPPRLDLLLTFEFLYLIFLFAFSLFSTAAVSPSSSPTQILTFLLRQWRPRSSPLVPLPRAPNCTLPLYVGQLLIRSGIATLRFIEDHPPRSCSPGSNLASRVWI
ncbi:hypothetical protein CRG98_021602 [Punica granatum]|uniref:Uncharacterized protein n=1 Tax=Punica granatum TaxID=22663 RepID=A0A2I0JP26_PUNGR|nr:hypothetical protein CRG98_021602 [Punica granatum]